MKHFFSNKNTKERRLIGFAGEVPKGSEDTPDTPRDTTEKKDSSAEKVGEVDDPEKLEYATEKAAKDKAEEAGEDSKDAKETVADSELKTAKADFEAMNMSTGDLELALKEVNQGTNKFKLNADKSGIELSEPPKDDRETGGDASTTKPGESAEDEKEDLPPLTEKEQSMKESITKMDLGLNEEATEGLVRAMTAIANALKALREMFGKGTSADVSDEKGDTVAQDATESAEVGSEDLDPQNSENPKEDSDKVKADIEELTTDRKALEMQVSNLEDGGVDSDSNEADKMIALLGKIKKIDAQIKTKEAEATTLDEELARRADVINKAWNKATPKGGLIESVALDTEDGNDIVVRFADGVSFTDLPAEQQAALTAMGITAAGNTLVLKDVPPTMYGDRGEEQRDVIINMLAGLTSKPAKSKPESTETPLENNDEIRDSNENVTRTRIILEQNRQRQEDAYDTNKASKTETKQDVQNVVDALDAEISYLESNNVTVTRVIDGGDKPLVDQLKEKRANFRNALARYPAGKADPDTIPVSDEKYIRQTVESYRREKEAEYDTDPTRESAQKVINAINAELQYLIQSNQNPERRGEDGAKGLVQRLEEKRDNYLQKLGGPTEESATPGDPEATPSPKDSTETPPSKNEPETDEGPSEASETASESLRQSLLGQKNSIIAKLTRSEVDGEGIMNKIIKNNPEYTLDELVKPENKETLVPYQMHMRELEKAANANATWSPIEGYGKTNGKGNVFMYKLEGDTLAAFTPPGNFQELNLVSGTWSYGSPSKDLPNTYKSVVNNVDADSYEPNDTLENALRAGNTQAVSVIAKDPSVWTKKNTEILTRLGFDRPKDPS